MARPSSLLATATALALAMLVAAPLAHADVAPPNTADCQTKQLGAACKLDDGSMGLCAAMTCNRPLPDGGTQSNPCNVCQHGADGGTVDGGTTTTTTTTTSSSNCSVASRAGSAGSALALFGLALGAAALLGRRRRHSS
jgi:MYXO-CTERM domain-containing protein